MALDLEIFNLMFLKENVGILDIISTAIRDTHIRRKFAYSRISNVKAKPAHTNSMDIGRRTNPAPAGDGTPKK